MPGQTSPTPSGISIADLDALLDAAPGRHEWTPEEDAIMRTYYPRAARERKVRVLYDYLCAHYGPRSLAALQEHARKLGIQGRGGEV